MNNWMNNKYRQASPKSGQIILVDPDAETRVTLYSPTLVSEMLCATEILMTLSDDDDFNNDFVGVDVYVVNFNGTATKIIGSPRMEKTSVVTLIKYWDLDPIDSLRVPERWVTLSSALQGMVAEKIDSYKPTFNAAKAAYSFANFLMDIQAGKFDEGGTIQ